MLSQALESSGLEIVCQILLDFDNQPGIGYADSLAFRRLGMAARQMIQKRIQIGFLQSAVLLVSASLLG